MAKEWAQNIILIDFFYGCLQVKTLQAQILQITNSIFGQILIVLVQSLKTQTVPGSILGFEVSLWMSMSANKCLALWPSDDEGQSMTMAVCHSKLNQDLWSNRLYFKVVTVFMSLMCCTTFSGGTPFALVKLNLVNLNRQVKMYSQGMAPVFRILPGRGLWDRIREKPTYTVRTFQFQFFSFFSLNWGCF